MRGKWCRNGNCVPDCERTSEDVLRVFKRISDENAEVLGFCPRYAAPACVAHVAATALHHPCSPLRLPTAVRTSRPCVAVLLIHLACAALICAARAPCCCTHPTHSWLRARAACCAPHCLRSSGATPSTTTPPAAPGSLSTSRPRVRGGSGCFFLPESGCRCVLGPASAKQFHAAGCVA